MSQTDGRFLILTVLYIGLAFALLLVTSILSYRIGELSRLVATLGAQCP